MNKQKIVVVIPIHSEFPSHYEMISFRQCFNILGKYDIKIVAPYGLSLNQFKDIVTELDVIYIDPKWQDSLIKYNKLKTSKFFYNLFEKYEFLLTYELDAFIFKDELEYWCNQSYDYIGAPWFSGYNNATSDDNLIGVGNSGFSLRKINSAKKVLEKIHYFAEESSRISRIKNTLTRPYKLFYNLMGENYTVQHDFKGFEDIFFGVVAPQYFDWFKVAKADAAMRFSFEVLPEKLFVINNQMLPMGCHAWWRYNLDFWKPFIKQFGFKI